MVDQVRTPIQSIYCYFEQRLLKFWFEKYKAYCLDLDEGEAHLFAGHQTVDTQNLCPKLRQFDQAINDHGLRTYLGIGCYLVPVEDKNTIVYHLETDGDDAWLYVFSEAGEVLALGYRYIEVIDWETPVTLQQCSENIADLLTLLERQPNDLSDQTFWGKPFSEVEASVTERLRSLNDCNKKGHP